jgi:hypothetical protein
MGQIIRSAFAQPIQLTASRTWTLTDQAGVGRTVTFGAGASTSAPIWARHFFVEPAGTGSSETDLIGFSDYVESCLNTGIGGPPVWHVTPTVDGFFQFRYSGTGTASVTVIDSVIAPILGVETTFGGLTNGGATYTGTKHPTHILYAASRIDDTDWVPQPPTIGGVESDDGDVDTLSSGITGAEREFMFRAHPRNWAIRGARGAAISPMYSDETVWTSQHLDTAGLTGWSVQRFMMSSASRRVAAYFQWNILIPYLLTGTGTIPSFNFYEGKWSLDTLQNRKPTRPTRPYYEELIDWGPVRFRFMRYPSIL